MRSSISQYLYSVFRQVMHEFCFLGNKFIQIFQRTSLPRILIFCIGLSLVFTIIPLVLILFVVFILFKLLLILAFTVRKHPSELDYQGRNPDRKYKDFKEK
jgi:uncharacterized membrane protein